MLHMVSILRNSFTQSKETKKNNAHVKKKNAQNKENKLVRKNILSKVSLYLTAK